MTQALQPRTRKTHLSRAKRLVRQASRSALRLAAPAAFVLVLWCAILLGGASRENQLQVASIGLFALAGLAVARLTAHASNTRPAPFVLRLMLALAVGLVLLQLLPLPYELWAMVPGRATAAEGLRQLGLDGGWRPLSLAPEYTAAAALAFIAPVCVLMIGLRLGWRMLGNIIAWTALVAGVAGSAAGLAQGIGLLPNPYPWTNPGAAPGVFANANHQASFLLMCLPFVAAMAGNAREKAESQGVGNDLALLWGAAGAIILLGVVIAGSLFGYLLAPVIVALSAIIGSRDPLDLGWPKLAAGLGLSLGALLLVAFTSGFDQLGQAGNVEGPQSRGEIYTNTLRAIGDHAPLGAGLGAFERIYPLYEQGEGPPATFVNAAHNEYLQLALELGAPGLLILALGLGWLAMRMAGPWVGGRDYGTLRRLKLAASICLIVPVLHALVDYPLRTQAVACLAAAAVAMLLGERAGRKTLAVSGDPTDGSKPGVSD